MAENSKEEQEEFYRRVGERIKALRIAKGYANYEKFANDHDFARAQYGRYERGINLELATMRKLFKALGISFAEFFRDFNE